MALSYRSCAGRHWSFAAQAAAEREQQQQRQAADEASAPQADEACTVRFDESEVDDARGAVDAAVARYGGAVDDASARYAWCILLKFPKILMHFPRGAWGL